MNEEMEEEEVNVVIESLGLSQRLKEFPSRWLGPIVRGVYPEILGVV